MPSTASLPSLAHLRLAGPDCASFLQGYVTTDVDNLPNGWSFSAFTNLKGRVFATVLLRKVEREAIDLIVSADIAEGLASFLAKYLMFAKCALAAIEGTPLLTDHVNAIRMTGDPSQTDLPTSLSGQRRASLHLLTRDELADAEGADRDGTDWWLEILISAGLGWTGLSASEQHLPQMLGLLAHDAVSFKKGCYLGQEIVARVEHRGSVKRHLVALSYVCDNNEEVPEVGCPLVADSGKEVGNLVIVRPNARQALAVTTIDASNLTSQQPSAAFEPLSGS